MATATEPIVSIHWCAQDLMSEFGLSEDDSASFLSEIRSILEERSIELGWAIIHHIVSEATRGEI